MPTNAQVQAAIATIGPQYLADAVTRSAEFYDLIPKIGPSDPKGPRWHIKSAGNTSAGQYTPGGALPAAGSAVFDAASMNWGNFSAVVEFNNRQLVQLEQAAANPSQLLVDQIMEQLRDQAIALTEIINTGLLSGTDTSNGIVGITEAIDDANTYAGIDRSTTTEFACYVAANSGTPRALTVSIMDTAYDYFLNTIKRQAGRWAILTGTAQATVMRGFSTGAITPYVYVPAAPVDGVQIPAPKLLSHANIQYRDVPVITIPGYTTGRIDFVNLDELAIECLNGAATPFRMGSTANPDGVLYSGDLTQYVLYAWMQLRLRNPKHNAFSIQDLS